MKENEKTDNSGWWILALIFVAVIIFFLVRHFNASARIEREEEENKIREEIAKLEKEKEIAEKHQATYEFIENYLNNQAKRVYKILMRIIIGIFIIVNVLIYLLVPKIEIVELVNLNVAILGVLAVVEFIVYLKIKGWHKRIEEALKEVIEYKIFGDRGRGYFLQKSLEAAERKEGAEQRLTEIKNNNDDSNLKITSS